MNEVRLEIRNRLGLHARAAARFVHRANAFRSRIEVIKGAATVDGKSILGLLTLAAARGTRLTLRVEGPDAEQAVAALAALVDDRFGEAE